MYYTTLMLDKPSDEVPSFIAVCHGEIPQQTIAFGNTTLDTAFNQIRLEMSRLPSDTKVTDIHIKVMK